MTQPVQLRSADLHMVNKGQRNPVLQLVFPFALSAELNYFKK